MKFYPGSAKKITILCRKNACLDVQNNKSNVKNCAFEHFYLNLKDYLDLVDLDTFVSRERPYYFFHSDILRSQINLFIITGKGKQSLVIQ